MSRPSQKGKARATLRRLNSTVPHAKNVKAWIQAMFNESGKLLDLKLDQSLGGKDSEDILLIMGFREVFSKSAAKESEMPGFTEGYEKAGQVNVGLGRPFGYYSKGMSSKLKSTEGGPNVIQVVEHFLALLAKGHVEQITKPDR